MLFLFASAYATAVPIMGAYPCQRLNWAWRNVWNTCSILNTVPNTAAGGANPSFFVQGSTGNFQLDQNGQFLPVAAAGGGNGPVLCSTSPNTGTNQARNRCRRMMDVYGNLVWLCSLGPAKTAAGPNTGTPDYLPQVAHGPHATNAKNLGYQAAVCLTGNGINYMAPGNTCPGLSGWFNVVWNACSFTNAPSVATVPGAPAGLPGLFNVLAITPQNSPNGLPAGSPTYQMNTPAFLCGSVTTPTSTTGPIAYAGKGTWFRTTRCRKALDAFGRAGARCGPSSLAPSLQQIQVPFDQLHFLAINMAGMTPYCNS